MTSSEEIRENIEEEKAPPHVNFRDDPVNAADAPGQLMPHHDPDSKQQKSSILTMFTNFFSGKAEEGKGNDDEHLGSGQTNEKSSQPAARKASKSMQVVWPMQFRT